MEVGEKPAIERWWDGHREIGVEKARDCRVAIVVQQKRKKKERKEGNVNREDDVVWTMKDCV